MAEPLAPPKVSRTVVWLAAVAAVEAALFVWKSGHFFNGDSLFFFSHRLESWSDVVRVFSGPDHLWQYRPLTFVLFSFVLHPLFGLDPTGYNLVPLAVHFANTILVYGIVSELVSGRRAALIAAFFFGTHPVAFYVTYGVAFLPDFSYAFFYLLTVWLFLAGRRPERRRIALLAPACFGLSLLCKEAAVTLPFVLAALALGRASAPPFSVKARLPAAARALGPFFAIEAAYLAFHWFTKGGSIYPAGLTHPHHGELSLAVLASKYKYLKWTLGLPDGLVFEFQGWVNYLLAAAIAVVAGAFALELGRWVRERRPELVLGISWFVIALSPVLVLRNLTMHHNLYVPLVGAALMVGVWLDRIGADPSGARSLRRGFIVAAAAAVMVAATVHHNLGAARSSWIAEASAIAEQSLADLRRQRPDLPEGASLYVLNSTERDLAWFYDYGSLFRLFYDDPTLRVTFATPDDPQLDERIAAEKPIVLVFDGRRLTDVTHRAATQSAAGSAP